MFRVQTPLLGPCSDSSAINLDNITDFGNIHKLIQKMQEYILNLETHIAYLIHQSLTVHFGKDPSLIVIPATHNILLLFYPPS